MIGQLLVLTRIDSGVDRGSPVRLDLTNVVQEVASDGDFEARARNRRVSIVRADACTLSGFEEVMRSAVENVVRNAIRHTAEGTTVDVSVQAEGPRVRIRVADHGPGVPESMLSEIFLPFRRIGTGIQMARDWGSRSLRALLMFIAGRFARRTRPLVD